MISYEGVTVGNNGVGIDIIELLEICLGTGALALIYFCTVEYAVGYVWVFLEDLFVPKSRRKTCFKTYQPACPGACRFLFHGDKGLIFRWSQATYRDDQSEPGRGNSRLPITCVLRIKTWAS